MLTSHVPGKKSLFHLSDVNGRDKHVVADRREQTIGDEQHPRLLIHRQRQNPLDQRGEQLLIMNDRHHGKKHHQQRGKRHGVLECAAQAMLVGDAGKRSDQHNHHQTDQADFSQVKRQATNQNQRRRPLHQQRRRLTGRAFGVVLGSVVSQHSADVVRQQRAVSEPAQLLQQHASNQTRHQYRQRHRGNFLEELAEMPAHLMADQQVLRLTDQGADATERRADRAVHQQAAQESAELIQVLMVSRR